MVLDHSPLKLNWNVRGRQAASLSVQARLHCGIEQFSTGAPDVLMSKLVVHCYHVEPL